MTPSPVQIEVRADELTEAGVLRTEHARQLARILTDRDINGFALIPSDTCYSLAARPSGPAKSRLINRILDRKEEPISLAFDNSTRVGEWVELSEGARRLLDRLTPGPLTVVLPVNPLSPHLPATIVNDVLTVPDGTLGVRIPDSPIETQLVGASNSPLTTVAVRTRDAAKTAVTDFEEARRIVLEGIAALGEPVQLGIVETNRKFRSAHSTVVRVPGKNDVPYDLIRLGAYSTAVLNEELGISTITVAPDAVDAPQIAGWLSGGAVLIVPTETVYGLAIKPGDPASAQRVFELKARPRDFNLPIVIGAVEQLSTLGLDFNDVAQRLAQRFWPGPLTIVMGYRSDAQRPPWLAGRIEAAIRFPDFPLLREVALAGGPILLTSANAHGTGAKNVAREAVESLHGAVDYVIDGGTLSPTPSTIVNCRLQPAVIERMGAVTERDLQEFIARGDVVLGQTP